MTSQRLKWGGSLVAVAAAVAAIIAGGGGGASPTMANIFAVPSGATGTCVRQAAPTTFATATANAKCSIPDAYAAANQGDTVLVRDGSYGNVTIPADAAKATGTCDVGATSTCVTIRSQNLHGATLTDLTTRASNVYLDGFNFVRTGATGDGGPSAKSGKYVVYANMRATGFYIAQEAANPKPENIHVYGGEYGPYSTCPGGGMKIGSEQADNPTDVAMMPKNITIEGTYIHDYKITPGCPQNHMDCLHTRALDGYFRFLRNRVHGCEDYALLMDGNTDAVADDILVENNMIGANVSGTSSLALHGGASGDIFNGTVIFRNNSADGGVTPQTTNTLTGTIKFVNNYAPEMGSCRAGITYSHNIITTGSTCHASDISGPISVLNRALGDFHLTGTSNALGAGDPADCAAVDFDGQARPQGVCDVGADEVP